MQPVTVTQFQDHIFHGRWDAALALLPRLTYDPNVALQAGVSLVTYWVIAPTALHSHSGHCCRACSACVLYMQCGDAGIQCSLQARFLIIQQKYVEAVEAGHMSAALRTLRKELAPLKINEPQLRKLAGNIANTSCASYPTIFPWQLVLCAGDDKFLN